MDWKNILNILLFGSIWGLAEALVGGGLHAVSASLTGTIMMPVGFAVLFAASKNGVRPSGLFLVSIIAALFKLSDSLLFGVPLFDKTIIIPAAAILTQAPAYTLFFRNGKEDAGIFSLAARFAGAVVLSVVAFNIVSMLLFGPATSHTLKSPLSTLIKLPIMTLLSVALSIALKEALKRIQLEIPTPLKAACCLVCTALTITARSIAQ